MKRYTMAAACLAVCCIAGLAQAEPAVWGGGDGFWNDDKWSFDGQTALFADEVLGVNTGMQVGNGELTTDAVIGGGNVIFESDLWGDFQFNSKAPGNGGTLTITGGASLSMNTGEGDVDGNWTQFNADTLNLDNGTLRRTFSSPAEAGGVFSFGGIRGYDGMDIKVNLSNGGQIENDGLLTFGWYLNDYQDRKVTMTINDGSLNLANSGDFDFLGGQVGGAGNGVLQFHYTWDVEANVANNDQYAVDFTGPGSITVDHSGILVVVQEGPGDADFGDFSSITTPVTYEQLWDRGILQANGFSGTQGVNFNSFFSVTGSSGADGYTLTSNMVPAVPIVWGGGDGNWNDDKWTAGAQSALFADEALGRNDGLRVGSGELGTNIFINGGNVEFDTNPWGGFVFKSGGTLNLSGGAVLTVVSRDSTDTDGDWTIWDADALVIDGATFRRTWENPTTGTAQAGGLMMLGSWNSYENQEINIEIKNGGTFENDGQLWFGGDEEHALGLAVSMTIDDGTLDLTGGDNYPQSNNSNDVYADLAFFYGTDQGDGDGSTSSFLPKGEDYEINFVGPGSIIVDTGGIVVYVQDDLGVWDQPADGTLATRSTYEDLWNAGILKADGLSGLDGEAFGDYFTVMGSLGAVDYTLISKVGVVGLPGDFDGDGDVDGNDFIYWQLNDGSAANLAIWQGNFGATGAVASVGAVPEPASLMLVLMGSLALLTTRRRG